MTTFESSGIFGDRYGLPIPPFADEIANRIEPDACGLISEVVDDLAERPAIELIVKAGHAGVILVGESGRLISSSSAIAVGAL